MPQPIRNTIIATLLAITLAGCNDHAAQMQSQLNTIRLLVKESAVLATQAACAPASTKNDIIHASVTLLRRAMGGKEMAAIHKMMGAMPEMSSDSADAAKQMAMQDQHQDAMEGSHIAIHDAGEATFAFLDALGQRSAPSCQDVQPAQLAATAALLRETDDFPLQQAEKQLQQRQNALSTTSPKSVTILAKALANI